MLCAHKRRYFIAERLNSHNSPVFSSHLHYGLLGKNIINTCGRQAGSEEEEEKITQKIFFFECLSIDCCCCWCVPIYSPPLNILKNIYKFSTRSFDKNPTWKNHHRKSKRWKSHNLFLFFLLNYLQNVKGLMKLKTEDWRQ